MPRAYEIIKTTWKFLFPATVFCLLGLLLHHHWQIVTAVIPLEFYEGTVPYITGIFADGGNPYTKEFQPQSAFVYPPAYNIFVAFLCQWFENTLQLHRAVSAVFILFGAGLVGFAAWKTSKSGWHGFATAVVLYAALLYYGTPVAGTNAPGVALFLAGTIVPWLCNFSNRSLFFALLCGILSFYTKQYFVLGIAILCLYMFLYISIYRALVLGFAFAMALAASLYIVHTTSPYYLDNTLFAPAAAIGMLRNWHSLGIQIQLFAKVYAGFLFVLLVVGASAVMHCRRNGIWPAIKAKFSLENGGFNAPLLHNATDYFVFSFFWSSVAIIFWLGQNPGNYMTYLFQLVSPFFLIVVFRVFSRLRGKFQILHPLMLVSFYQVYSILPHDFTVDMKQWQKAERLIAKSELVLASPILVNTLFEQGKTIYQDGHTFYFPLAHIKPQFMVKTNEEDRVPHIWQAYIKDLYNKVRNREFDLILVSRLEINGIFNSNSPPNSEQLGRDVLQKFYKRRGKLVLSLTDRRGGGTHTIYIYRPRQKPLPD